MGWNDLRKSSRVVDADIPGGNDSCCDPLQNVRWKTMLDIKMLQKHNWLRLIATRTEEPNDIFSAVLFHIYTVV